MATQLIAKEITVDGVIYRVFPRNTDFEKYYVSSSERNNIKNKLNEIVDRIESKGDADNKKKSTTVKCIQSFTDKPIDLPKMVSIEEKAQYEIDESFKSIQTWNYDVFSHYIGKVKGHFAYFAMKTINQDNLLKYACIDENTFCRLVESVERFNPGKEEYIMDCLQAAYYFINVLKIKNSIGHLQTFTLYVALLMKDLQPPKVDSLEYKLLTQCCGGSFQGILDILKTAYETICDYDKFTKKEKKDLYLVRA